MAYPDWVLKLFLFSLDHHMPSYFRIVAGSNMRCVIITPDRKKAGIKNAVLITDKGFYSEGNILALEKERNERLHYIIPLRRNSSLTDYTRIRQGNRKAFDWYWYFLFEKRAIWYYSYELE